MIIAKNIHKYYGNLHVLKGVDLNVQRGEIVSIVGSSGAGKTTLLQVLGTLDSIERKQSSELVVDGVRISSLRGDKELSTFRNTKIGFIFQFHQLLPEFTALENICIPAYIQKVSKSQSEKRASELLSFLGLSDRRDHKPSQLSGGEQQRVAVARALMNSPSVILADEPSGNLDSKSAQELHKLFFSLRDEFGKTFVIVTHNNVLANAADRKLQMTDGKIVS